MKNQVGCVKRVDIMETLFAEFFINIDPYQIQQLDG